MIFSAGLLEYKLKQINTDYLSNDFLLRLFLINDIDTNLISIFLPEIWDFQQSQFAVRDDNGNVIKDIVYPCEIHISAYNQAPKITFTQETSNFFSYLKLNIVC